jgi:hypothetical protein
MATWLKADDSQQEHETGKDMRGGNRERRSKDFSG